MTTIGGRSLGAPELSNARPAAGTLPDGLDWAAFSTRYFPGRRRHDFEAVKAYEAYGNGSRQMPRPKVE
jgi:hypothetical protein